MDFFIYVFLIKKKTKQNQHNDICIVITHLVELLFKYLLCRYPLDVTRRRMQLGAVLPDSEKCL